jgi:small conductance mechanosensitive channel
MARVGIIRGACQTPVDTGQADGQTKTDGNENMNDVKLPDLGFTWDEAIDMLTTNGVDLGINILTALVIFYVGRWFISIAMRGLRKVLQKQEIDKTLESFVCNLVRTVLLVFVVVAAISALGIQTTSFIAVLGAAGLAVGLALQGSLSNFASGVLIVLFRPYKVGDFVEAAGISGSVEEVQILTTVLKTGDNKRVIVPNSQIMDSIITNYSANDTRRVDMVVGVSYSDDLDKVRQTLEDLVAAEARILDEPACTIAVSALADSSVNFVVRPWVASADYWGVMFDMTEAIKKRFDKEGITFPFPQQDVHLYNASSDS